MQRDEILRLLEQNREEITRFGVTSLRPFGSVARDEASEESDVDILVDFAASPSFSKFMKLRI